MSTETISWGHEYINMSNIMSHIIMAIISHEHTNTLKFILSDLNMFHNAHIKSIYYAALCSENIPIIKHLQQTFDDNIDILSATENKEVSTDILDYLVGMQVKAVDVSKIIRLCAQLKQRTLNPKILSAIKSTAGGCYSK